MEEDGRVTQVLGRRRYLRMYKWTTAVNKKHAVIPIDAEMQAICVEAAFFLSALFARFPYTPSASSPAAPTLAPPPLTPASRK